MKKLRLIVLALAMMLMVTMVGYAADETMEDSPEISVTQSTSLENAVLLADAPSITPCDADDGVSLVIGTNGVFRFNIVGGGSNYGWMKILGAKDDTVYTSARAVLGAYSSGKVWEITWTTNTAACKDGKPLPLGTYRLVCYVGDQDGNVISGETVHTTTFMVVPKAIALTDLAIYNTADQSTVKDLTVCPGKDENVKLGAQFTPANATGYRNLAYTSSDPEILEVTYAQGYGVLTPKKAGTVTVTLTAMDKDYKNEVVGTKTAQVQITVHNPDKDAATVVKESTATRPGQAKTTCTRCGAEITYELSPVFTDTDQEYYFDAVDDFYANKYIRGISTTEFGPSVSLSRAMVVTILHRMEGEPKPTKDAPFSDLEKGLYYVDPVAWAAEKKIVEGMGDGTFAPNTAISRQDLATILLRYAEYKGLDVTGRDDLKAFPDANKVSDYAQNAVAWCVKSGIINGVLQPDGVTSCVAPQNETRRCDAVTMLYRFRNLLENDDQPLSVTEPTANEADATYSAAPKVT